MRLLVIFVGVHTPIVIFPVLVFTTPARNQPNLLLLLKKKRYPSWFVLEGLLRHADAGATSLRAVANELVKTWASAVQVGGIYEMWNPLTGAGEGVVGLGMSTLIVDALVRTGGAVVEA